MLRAVNIHSTPPTPDLLYLQGNRLSDEYMPYDLNALRETIEKLLNK